LRTVPIAGKLGGAIHARGEGGVLVGKQVVLPTKGEDCPLLERGRSGESIAFKKERKQYFWKGGGPGCDNWSEKN